MSETRQAGRTEGAAGATRSPGAGWLVVALALVSLHMVLFDRGMGGDGWATFAFVESAVEDGDLVLENNNHGVLNGLVTRPDGHLVMQYPPGLPLLDLAPFLLGRLADAVLPSSWVARDVVLPPVGPVPRRVFFEVAAVVLARNLAVLVGLWAIAAALSCLGVAGRRRAVAAALTFFAGPLLFYALVGMSHAPSFALAALLLLVLARRGGAVSGRAAAAAGLLVGATVLVRFSAAALLPAALLAGWRGARWRGAGAVLGGFALPLAVLPFFWRLHHGQWSPLEYGGLWRLTAASPFNVLLAPQHGLFVFHPALLVAAAGLVLACRAAAPGRRAIARDGVVWVLAVALVHGWWSDWANPGGWGQRFMTDALPPLAVGFAAALEAVRWRRTIRAAALVLTVAGYLLFFAAVGRLARAPAGHPWPQRLADYRPLVESPPPPRELAFAFLRASFAGRAVLGPPPAAAGGR